MPRLLSRAALTLVLLAAVCGLAGCGSSSSHSVTTIAAPTHTTASPAVSTMSVSSTGMDDPTTSSTLTTATPATTTSANPPSSTTTTAPATTTTATPGVTTGAAPSTSANGVVCPAGTVVRGLACETPDGHDAGVNPIQCPSGYTPSDGGCAPGAAGSNTDPDDDTSTGAN